MAVGSNVATLLVSIGSDISSLEKGLSKAQRQIQDAGRSMKRVGRNMTAALTLPLVGAGVAALKSAAEFESLQQSMNILNGSIEEGARNFERLKKFSAKTPFQLNDLASAQNMLQGFGLSADNAFNSLSMIGDISAVTGGSINGIGIAFGQAAAEGRLMTRDIRQLINQGVPAINLLADTMGVAKSEVLELASEGKISFEILQQTFKDATSEGGLFADGMEKQSKTLSGVWSTFKDNVSIALAEMGQSLAENLDIKELTRRVTDNIKMMTDWFTSLSADTQASMITLVAVIGAGGPVIYALGAMTTAVSSLAKAMLFLSSTAIPAVIGALESLYLVALLNPVVAAITAITAAVGLLGYAAVRSHKKTKKLWDQIAQLKAVDVESESWRDLEKRIDSIKAKIKDANKSVISQMTTDPAAYKELNDQLKIFEDRLREIRPLIFKTGQMIAEELGGTVFEALNNKKDTGPLIYRQKVKVETDVVTDTGGVMPEVPVKPVIQSIKPKDWEPIVDIDIPELELDVGVPADSIAYVQEEIAKTEKAITLATSQGERDRLDIRKSSLEKQLESMKTQGEEAMELGQAIQTALSNAFAALGETLSDIFTGDGGATTFFNKMLSIIASFMSTFGKLMIAFGVAKAEISFSGNPFVAIAAGVALIAVAGAIKSHLNNGPEDTPKLAKGGLAFGPTMAVVGDNKGARSNPEVIAPLDKLKSMMGNMGGTQRVIVEGRLRGSDIFISNKRGQDIFR